MDLARRHLEQAYHSGDPEALQPLIRLLERIQDQPALCELGQHTLLPGKVFDGARLLNDHHFRECSACDDRIPVYWVCHEPTTVGGSIRVVGGDGWSDGVGGSVAVSGGLLCNSCNTSLGAPGDSPQRVEGLLRYAAKHCGEPGNGENHVKSFSTL